jgi:hypothetical protein
MAQGTWLRPLTAIERYLYSGGFIAGLGFGTFLGYGLHSLGFVNVNAGIMFLPCFFLTLILGPVIARRGREAKRETD